jgi:predicted dehydrogenase
MRFALFGDHPDGLDMARALAGSGRHELDVYAGPAVAADYLTRWDLQPRRVGDLEEVLADPGIDAVIVAGRAAVRPDQLRRALQSERHVLCVHPAGPSPDIAYEAAMIRDDTHCVLLPLLPEALHPAVRRLSELARTDGDEPRLLEMERWSTEELVLSAEEGRGPGLPGWDVLRAVGGEIAELFAVAGVPEELTPGEPLVLSGRFTDGLLFQVTLLPQQAAPRWRLALVRRTGRLTLEFPDGWPGPSRLSYTDATGAARVEEWPALDPWAALVEVFEEAVRAPQAAAALWQDEQRALELDDAARRSVERRRSSTLEYQDATEEAGFKGTMTLVGCGLLWLSLVLLIVSPWAPKLLWAVAPVFGVFLVLQVLRWVIPARAKEKDSSAL